MSDEEEKKIKFWKNMSINFKFQMLHDYYNAENKTNTKKNHKLFSSQFPPLFKMPY